jgi:DNA polymerase I-like protein with 3'-5' exonuclease and polymerase domains
VQGATNRVVMDAMNRLSELEDWLYQPNMQIHDDLTWCFDTEREFETCTPRILDIMLDGSAFPWFCVPISVEVECGPNWGETQPIGTYYSHKRLGWPIRAKEFM